jgi:CheY-like chemotaxis protein
VSSVSVGKVEGRAQSKFRVEKMKRTAVFQIIENDTVVQLLFVEFSETQSPLGFVQRINERGSKRTIRLLGMEDEMSMEDLPLGIAYRAPTLEMAQSFALRGAWEDRTALTLRRSVLLLEIDDLVRSMVRKGLELNNFEVFAAGARVEAEAIARWLIVDLLLLDIRSLGEQAMAGIQAIKTSQPEAKVLLLSEDERWTVASHPGRMLGNGFLQKPFTVQLLLAAIEQIGVLGGSVPRMNR